MPGVTWMPSYEFRWLTKEKIDLHEITYNPPILQQKFHGTEHKMVGSEVQVFSHEKWVDIPSVEVIQ